MKEALVIGGSNGIGLAIALELQKKGYYDFVNYYLPKLFEDNMPVWDLGNDRLRIEISELKVAEPTESIETCKKKDLTYGGIITANIKLIEMVEDPKTHKKSESLDRKSVV